MLITDKDIVFISFLKDLSKEFKKKEIAAMLGITYNYLNMFENGTRELSLDIKKRIISLNNANKKQTKLKRDLETSNIIIGDLGMMRKQIDDVVESVLPHTMYVPLVNQYAYAGYLNGYGDNEYIDDLPKIPFHLDRQYKGSYLCFEVRGDSMDSGEADTYIEGDILLCREIQQHHWQNKLHINKYDFVIVHITDGITLKRITSHSIETGELQLKPLNSFYEPYTINIKDVVKIFNATLFIY